MILPQEGQFFPSGVLRQKNSCILLQFLIKLCSKKCPKWYCWPVFLRQCKLSNKNLTFLSSAPVKPNAQVLESTTFLQCNVYWKYPQCYCACKVFWGCMLYTPLFPPCFVDIFRQEGSRVLYPVPCLASCIFFFKWRIWNWRGNCGQKRPSSCLFQKQLPLCGHERLSGTRCRLRATGVQPRPGERPYWRWGWKLHNIHQVICIFWFFLIMRNF